ncbi:hypothetical protein Q3V37_01995 [Micromonospora profundi]|uniref:Uncharacterized protein n=1 Tax=Micromonospora profundi TaxID=1420889 RepID=A0AAJ6HXS6_9ACTN|nr:hypothetical protein [Micromonospora profundi]WLS46084.1 hypothetical protein Q3V37_01995 [Micromonospora profundi]
MTKQPGRAPTAESDQPAVDATPDGRLAPAPGAAVLALVALGWLAAMLWSTREAITSSAAGVTAISLSAFALPGVISAALVAGAATALAFGNLLSRRYGDSITLRFVGAIGAGMVVGLAAALAINLTYFDTSTTNVIAGTTAAAAIIGGAVAGARTAPAVGAVVTAALGTLIFVVAFSRARDPLFNLFGAGDTQQSLVDAAKWVSRTESLLAGLLAGLLAFGYLTWARRRALRRDPSTAALRWPAYLLAGAGPGLLLLLAEAIIRIGGRSLLDLASALSEADAVAQTSLGTSRVDNGIWVLFVGALTALIAFGRTLGPAPDDDEPDAPAGPAATPAAGTEPTDRAEPTDPDKAGADSVEDDPAKVDPAKVDPAR